MAKKKTREVKQSIDMQNYGPEPVVTEVASPSSSAYSKALSWYNYFYTVKEGRKWFHDDLKNSYPPEYLKAIKKLSDDHIPTTLCWIAKMKANGTKFAENITYYDNRIKDLLAINIEKPKKAEAAVKQTSPHERALRKAEAITERVIQEIDTFIVEERNRFSLFDFLTDQGHSPVMLSMLKDELKREIAGAEELKDSKPPVRFRPLVRFLKRLLDDVEKIEFTKKATKNVVARKKKPVSIDKKLQHIKYANQFEPLRLISIKPKDILTSNVLWLYNTKNKDITKLVAEAGKFLDVNGTTIQNIDLERSFKKSLRKPEEQMALFTQAGKVALRSYMDKLNTKARPATGRINGDTILLKVQTL